ncbi:MAG: STAS domain-containing protein [Chloroflexota bacterium]|nr:STAS domain-containing protein [Chloroflexota bacterium]
MNISVREHIVRIQIIEISGRLDASEVARLRAEQERLLSNGTSQFVVDLSNTNFMDSAGMSALVSLLKRARQLNGDVVLVKPVDAAAYRILSLTRFDQVFKMADTIDLAIKHF